MKNPKTGSAQKKRPAKDRRRALALAPCSALFRWLEKNPERINFCPGYLGTKAQWFYTDRGAARNAASLRDAIAGAQLADERFEERMRRLGFRDFKKRRAFANAPNVGDEPDARRISAPTPPKT